VKRCAGGSTDGESALVRHETSATVLPRSRACSSTFHVRQRIVVSCARQSLFDCHKIPIKAVSVRLRREGRNRNGILRNEHEEAWPFLRIAVITSAQTRTPDLVAQTKESHANSFQVVDVFAVQQTHDVFENCDGTRCLLNKIDQKER
jgi:hypothetical protein